MQRRENLLDVLHLEQTALVLVVGPSSVGSTPLWRLAVAEIQESRLLWSAMSSESEHASVLHLLAACRPAWITCRYAISARGVSPGIPRVSDSEKWPLR